MRTLAPVLTVALVFTGIIIWLFVFNWLTYSSLATLDAENQEIEATIMTEADTIDVDAYYWNEPHHRYDVHHPDPYFVQIFDERGRLLRASDNIRVFPSGTFPTELLTDQSSSGWPVQHLRMFRIADKQLYHRTEPIRDQSSKLLGYIQVSRYDPGVFDIMRRTTYYILSGIVLALLVLLGIVWWSARRVVAPLELITEDAHSLSPIQHGQRINVPAVSDRETAFLATSINNLLDRLERTFQEMQRFTSDAAHQLQTPLTILKGHVSVALKRQRSPEEYQKTLRVLRVQIEGLIRLVHSLLQLARLERDEEMPISEPIDLVAVTADAARYHKRQAEDKGLEFVMQLPANAWIKGDVNFVQQIVKNLLENAVKYTEKGRIDVAIEKEKESILLVIKDTGVGMSTEVLQHATDRFYRAPSIRAASIPGSGLGLALVSQIVARQNGILSIDSTPGEGTIVKVTFHHVHYAPDPVEALS